MGRWYLVHEADLASVPQFGELGPDAMALDEAGFVARLKQHRGQIKNVLTNQRCIAGIGNAYSDEILWEAGLHPHRSRSSMDDADLHRLYHAVHAVFERSLPVIEGFLAGGLKQNKTEWREHLQVHRRGGQPCPRCGDEIRSQVLSGRETNYCLRCQPLYAAGTRGDEGSDS
jgi:formamidopyrimidine-DNA glycosylase